MPPNPLHKTPDSLEPCDPIGEMFGLPTGQGGAPPDAPPAAPLQSSRLDAALSWLWRLIVDGFAAYGLAICPCIDPNELFDWPGPQREPATMAPAEQSPWYFEDLARGTMALRLSDDTTFTEIEPGTREQGTGKSGAR